MRIKVFYSGKDFFGHFDSMLECENSYADVQDLRAALRHMKKDSYCSIHIDDSYVITWDKYTDFENSVVTVREYERWNCYDEKKVAFDKMRKDILKAYAEREGTAA